MPREDACPLTDFRIHSPQHCAPALEEPQQDVVLSRIIKAWLYGAVVRHTWEYQMNLIETFAIQSIRQQEQNAKRRGFDKALRRALRATATDHNDEDEDSNALKPEFVPDLHCIDTQAQVITLWEIEDASTISETKLRGILRWWFTIDAAYEAWDVVLIVTDRYGLNWRRIDLALAYRTMVAFDVRDDRGV